jgi:hypothetical protein
MWIQPLAGGGAEAAVQKPPRPISKLAKAGGRPWRPRQRTPHHEVLTRLQHLKNKNKIMECLPDIEPWLAG